MKFKNGDFVWIDDDNDRPYMYFLSSDVVPDIINHTKNNFNLINYCGIKCYCDNENRLKIATLDEINKWFTKNINDTLYRAYYSKDKDVILLKIIGTTYIIDKRLKRPMNDILLAFITFYNIPIMQYDWHKGCIPEPKLKDNF